MKFYFARHAEKPKGDFFNALLRHDDQPISPFGKKQATRIKKYFLKHKIKSIYVSEYIRTEQTARPLARKLNIVPVVDSRLNEIDNGIIDKLTDEELRDNHPDVWKAIQDRNRDFRWPQGETGLEAQERVVSFIKEYSEPDGSILIVSHDGIIRILFCYVLGLPVYSRFNLKVDTASITEIEFDESNNR